MIKTKTLLILGAGASVDYGFPLGPELKDGILKLLDSETKCKNVLDCGFSYEDDAVPFREALGGSLGVATIDAFLRDRKEFIDFGRHMIAAALLPYEKQVNLNPVENWYQRLYGILNEDGFDNFGTNSLSIITFNYDRSLEHFLHETLKRGHGRSDNECAEQIRRIPIVHVHGQLGYLPWQKHGKKYTGSFGSRRTLENIKEAAQEIKVVHEASEKDDSFIKARGDIEIADRIFILGFGYHPTNLERLGLNPSSAVRGINPCF